MDIIFRNPEYSPFLTENDKNKFTTVQKALSIKDSVTESMTNQLIDYYID